MGLYWQLFYGCLIDKQSISHNDVGVLRDKCRENGWKLYSNDKVYVVDSMYCRLDDSNIYKQIRTDPNNHRVCRYGENTKIAPNDICNMLIQQLTVFNVNPRWILSKASTYSDGCDYEEK